MRQRSSRKFSSSPFHRQPGLRARRAVPRRSTFLQCEQARLRAHFAEVLAELGQRDVSALSPAQRATRERLLNDLARYAERGRFPRNLDFAGARAPYFLDAFGTPCAMAHLIESSGDWALVQRVAATKNNAFIRELEGDPDLQAWLERTGFTATEAARVQPTYCYESKAERCFCSTTTGGVGILEATVVARKDIRNVTLRVEALHGEVLGTTVGQEISGMDSHHQAGDVVLVTVHEGEEGPAYGVSHHPILADGTVQLGCGLETPVLTKADAIAGMLAIGANDSGLPSEQCIATLVQRNSAWEESVCSDNSLFGCAAAAGGPAAPLLMGSVLAFSVVWSRRRSRRRWSVRRRG